MYQVCITGTLRFKFPSHAGARKVYGAVVGCPGRIHGGLVPGGHRGSGGLGGAAQHIPHAGDDDEVHAAGGR